MTFLFMVSLLAIGAYFLWRRGRGPDQPTVAQDLKSLFSLRSKKSKLEEGFEASPSPEKLLRDRDGHSLEADPELTDADRIEEIIGLNDLWDQSGEAEAKKRDER